MEELVYKAICEDRPARLESFLNQGESPNMWIEDAARISAKTFLHVCCEKGRKECVKVLLKYGAQVDIQGSWGQTPLMLCVLVEYFDIAELLMNYDKTIKDQQDSNGNTSLHIAIGNDSVEGVELLTRYQTDANAMNTVGITPLMKICSTKESEHMSEIAKLLIKGGADVDMKDFKSRRTALQRAALAVNIDTVEVLLDAGADVNSQDGSGLTALCSLIVNQLRLYSSKKVIPDDVMAIVHLLVSSGANLNINTHETSNALILAIQYKCMPLVNYFLMNGAEVKGKFFGGITPLLHAVNKNDIDSVKVLLNWSCDVYHKARMFKYNYDTFYDSFDLAVHKGHVDMVLLLSMAGYNASKVDYLTDFSADVPECFQKQPEILQHLRDFVTAPPTLFSGAVMRIRGCLVDGIAIKSELLPLPKLLIEDVKRMMGVLY